MEIYQYPLKLDPLQHHQQTEKKWTKCYLRTRLRMERKLLWKKAVVEQVTLVEVQYEYASSTGEDEDSAEDIELEHGFQLFSYSSSTKL